MSVSARARWDELNERQRAYLSVIYREDQAAERARAAIGRAAGPETNWRNLPFVVKAPLGMAGDTAIQRALRAAGVHDAGAGSSLTALERRGLVTTSMDAIDLPPFGQVARVLVALTRIGRACARAGLGEKGSSRPPAGLLSEWLWRRLVDVALAEPEGVAEDGVLDRAKFHLGVGYGPAGRPSRGYIDCVPVMEGAGDAEYAREYRWRLTDAGRRHFAEQVEAYRELYPTVEVRGSGPASSGAASGG